jgi:hypothetical protein
MAGTTQFTMPIRATSLASLRTPSRSGLAVFPADGVYALRCLGTTVGTTSFGYHFGYQTDAQSPCNRAFGLFRLPVVAPV